MVSFIELTLLATREALHTCVDNVDHQDVDKRVGPEQMALARPFEATARHYITS